MWNSSKVERLGISSLLVDVDQSFGPVKLSDTVAQSLWKCRKNHRLLDWSMCQGES